MSKRINGQFDDRDESYRVETLETVSGFVTTWSRQTGNVTLRNAELIRKRFEQQGKQARVKHESDY